MNSTTTIVLCVTIIFVLIAFFVDHSVQYPYYNGVGRYVNNNNRYYGNQVGMMGYGGSNIGAGHYGQGRMMGYGQQQSIGRGNYGMFGNGMTMMGIEQEPNIHILNP